MTGTVKWFDSKKGFGFLMPQNPRDFREYGELYVHFSDIVCDGFKTLNAGELVEFEIIENEKGLRARHVILIGARLAPSNNIGPQHQSPGPLRNDHVRSQMPRAPRPFPHRD